MIRDWLRCGAIVSTDYPETGGIRIYLCHRWRWHGGPCGSREPSPNDGVT